MAIKGNKGKSLRGFIASACKKATRLFDLSRTSSTTRSLKNVLLCLSVRTAGVFLGTLGIYSFIISMILALFTERSVDSSGIYGGLLLAVCSAPLLFSKGNVSTALTNSRTGSFICHQLNIRKESLPYEPVINSLTAAFVLGIVFSLATLVIPFSYVIGAVAVAVMAAIVLHSPEAGLTFFVVCLFLTGVYLQFFILSITILSYVLKLIRGKRSLSLKKTDLILPVFAICTLGAMISSSKEAVSVENMKYFLFLVPYLLAVCLIRDCRNVKKLMGLSVALAGTLCAVYLLGSAIIAVLPRDVAVDPAFLINSVLSLPAFKNEFAPLLCATLIPVSIAFVMKPHSEGNRLTMFLCFVSMLSALIVSENIAHTAAAVIASVILILIAGNRKLYFFLSLLLGTTVIISFAGAFGERLYGYIFQSIKDSYSDVTKGYFQNGKAVFGQFVFCGQGFSEKASGTSFFYNVFYQLGLCGSIILAALVIAVLIEAVIIITKTYKTSSYKESIARFHTVADPAELRMGSVAMICAILAVIICGTFSDLYTTSASYAWMFLVCGLCSAYSASAGSSIDKARSAIYSDDCSERAAAVIKSSPSEI